MILFFIENFIHKSFKFLTFVVFTSSKEEYFDPVGSPLYDNQEAYFLSLFSHDIKMIKEKNK